MSIQLETIERINALKNGIEVITGESYNDLTEAVQDLKDGYGGGSSEGVTGIKYLEFDEETNLPTIADARGLEDAPAPTSRLGYALFYNTNATTVGGYHTQLKEVYIPSNLTYLTYTFHQCGKLEKIHGSLENVTNTGAGFRGCAALTEFPYMPKLHTIGTNTFADCTGLTEVKLYRKLTSCHSNAFDGCNNLKDIYVPWSEGEVDNAPWGAVNATIHYNTTYDENHNPIVEG